MAQIDTPPTDDPRPDSLKRVDSLVVLMTGPGKGKTSAAMGTVLRAVGHGKSAIVLQFVKSGEWKTGEQLGCERLGVPFEALGSGFTWDSNDIDHDAGLAREAWARAEQVIASGEYDLVVLDEITYLCTWKWIDTDRVVESIRQRPARVNIVLTGRDAPDALIACADTASRIESIHHAYDRGVGALRGIDY
jgi:cob(I)alamin adenosyltransferase